METRTEIIGTLPEQRGPWLAEGDVAGDVTRQDALANLRGVLRAARQVFGEQGYDAPVEEVARRAGVGVGTVYRRFRGKRALVRAVLVAEATRLADSAVAARGAEDSWQGVHAFLLDATESGAGRLLPRELADPASVSEVREVAVELGDQPLARLVDELALLVRHGQRTGGLRSSVTVSDLLLVLFAATGVADTSRRLLDLACAGLRP